MRASTPSAALPTAQRPEHIGALRGEFADPALEQTFRQDTLARMLPQQRLSVLVWAALLLVFAVPDYLSMGLVPDFWVLTVYRMGTVALLLAYVLALRYRPGWASDGCALMWLGLLAYPLFFLFYVLRPDIRAVNTGVIMVIQLTMFLFMPVRVMRALPVAVLGGVGASLSFCLTSPADTATKVATVFLVTMPAVMGYVAALRLQKTERQEFWLRRQLLDANSALKSEVERRVALQQELERQVATDVLTGLASRRAFVERFALEAARVQRSGEALTLVVFDLDHFKQVNDRYGHAAGDAVLRSVGQLCARSFRSFDMVARIGGEEFVALLSGASGPQAVTVVERFASCLAGTRIDLGAQSVYVTTTAGVAQQQPEESLEALMERADKDLYAGKQAGRNRVVLAPAPH